MGDVIDAGFRKPTVTVFDLQGREHTLSATSGRQTGEILTDEDIELLDPETVVSAPPKKSAKRSSVKKTQVATEEALPSVAEVSTPAPVSWPTTSPADPYSFMEGWDSQTVTLILTVGSGTLNVRLKAYNLRQDSAKITFSYRSEDVRLDFPVATQVTLRKEDGNAIDGTYMVDLDLFPGKDVRTAVIVENVTNIVD